ncbi:MAG: TonB-dependent receptor [Deltaproteobacteria bacterium]|nr:TonB-dependent receptor [Deltaproteobacteria bacterium]
MKKILFLLLAIIFFPVISLAEEKEATKLEDVVVTGTRETESAKEVPQTVGVVKGEDIKDLKPSHPKQVMNRVPGVWITSTAGEGHVTAIRQPLTTNPVYLYLEDGIPVRSTGFFNHNALYEVNMPAADRVEVMKGPGTALYGSDAIGGTINVMTRAPSLTPEIEINPEFGEYGWYRTLFSASNTWGNHGFRLDLNDTHSDGWVETTEYYRQSATFRYDYTIDATLSTKTVIVYSHIDAGEAANALSKTDFEQRPWYDYSTFTHRKVDAFRLSLDIEKETQGGKGLLSIIPYYRHNEMDLHPGWGIFSIGGTNYRGYHSETKFESFGFLAKYRYDFEPMRTRLILGVDVDYSPGEYFERRTIVTRDTTTLKYTSYTYDTNTDNNYDFDATFTGISPYVHIETSPFEKLRLTLGARYDDMEYDYDNNMTANANRPADTKKLFSHTSPKIGLTYAFTKDISAFLTYNNGFRVPSSGNLFRGSNGTASTAVNLKPIKIDSYEGGVKTGWLDNRLTFDASLYLMQKEDDIVSYKPTSSTTQSLNAGETEHKGIEIALGIKPVKEIGFDVAYSYAKHTYEEYRVSPTLDYSGKEIPIAPRQIVNTRLYYAPSIFNGGKVELEWVKLGKYWLDDANTEKYDGHDLLNVRASYKFNKSWEIYARGINVADEDYAERASKSAGASAQYAPGQPQTFYAGIAYHWGK